MITGTDEDKKLREVTTLSLEFKNNIISFLQGAVYCWCNLNRDNWFSARDFLGNDNRDWTGTPLMVLYDNHIKTGKSIEDAFIEAGKEAGWLLKYVIISDKRNFETKREDQIRKYRWII